jgi:hypothetical protein
MSVEKGHEETFRYRAITNALQRFLARLDDRASMGRDHCMTSNGDRFEGAYNKIDALLRKKIGGTKIHKVDLLIKRAPPPRLRVVCKLPGSNKD